MLEFLCYLILLIFWGGIEVLIFGIMIRDCFAPNATLLENACGVFEIIVAIIVVFLLYKVVKWELEDCRNNEF